MSFHPSITRTRIVRDCATCNGSGELVANVTNPYGYGPDPQCDIDVECDACNGEGEIVEWTDPLVEMRARRLSWRYWPQLADPLRRKGYALSRHVAMAHVHLPGDPVQYRMEKAA